MVVASLAVALVQAQRVQSLTGVVHRIQAFESRIMGNRRNLNVYLPPTYAYEPLRRYPVMYMHDGQNVFDGSTSFIPNMEWQADETADRMIRAGSLPPIIIVAIDNAQAQRADEYLPTRRKTGFSDNPIGGNADRYGRMITDEVMPLIDSRYRTKRGPANTGLAGSSFGGVVTLHLGMTRPDVFGRLGVVSPSVWWDDRVLVSRVKALPTKLPLRIWLDMGTKEGYQGLVDVRELKWALEGKGWQIGKDLHFMQDPLAQHNEAAWAKRMGPMLTFLWAN